MTTTPLWESWATDTSAGTIQPVTDALIEMRQTVLHGIMLRTWDATGDNIASDLRLTADEARTLAANLLHSAQLQDGQVVTFNWVNR